jgi:hypothetical protein
MQVVAMKRSHLKSRKKRQAESLDVLAEKCECQNNGSYRERRASVKQSWRSREAATVPD